MDRHFDLLFLHHVHKKETWHIKKEKAKRGIVEFDNDSDSDLEVMKEEAQKIEDRMYKEDKEHSGLWVLKLIPSIINNLHLLSQKKKKKRRRKQALNAIENNSHLQDHVETSIRPM